MLLPHCAFAAAAPSGQGEEEDPAADDQQAEEKPSAVPPAPASHSLNSPSFGSYLSGRFAESQGDTDHGTKFLRDSLKRDPNNKDMLASLYRMLILSGQIEEALPIAAKLAGTKVVEDGSEFSPEMLLAVEEGKKGRFAEAAKHLESVPKAGFNNLLVPLLQVWLKLGMNEIKAPIEAKDILPDAHMMLPHVYLNTALIDDAAGYDEAALKQYQASVKDTRIEPFRAIEALANYYSRKGLEDKRRKLVEEYLSAHGDSFLADEILAEPMGEHPKPLVNDAREGLAEVFYTMANIFHGVRAPADEIAILHLALYLRPDFPAAEFLLASTYELGQDYPAAIATYKTIDKHSPYFVRGRIRSVYDESEMGDKPAALAKLDTIATENPQDIDALLAKGDILRAGNHFKEAVDAYNAASQRIKTPQKHHWIVYFSRGASYEGMGQWDKAEADMKKALALNPGEADVLNYLGYSWLTQHRNIAEARKMIEDAYDARPEDPHIIDSMGYALYAAGDFTSAQEYFEQALERTPNDPTVNDHLGDTYWQQGRKTEARYQWQRALADDPDADAKRELHKKLENGLALFHPLAAVEDKKLAAPPAPANE
jgi:tetratricopeptide (TPR) repeat protein